MWPWLWIIKNNLQLYWINTITYRLENINQLRMTSVYIQTFQSFSTGSFPIIDGTVSPALLSVVLFLLPDESFPLSTGARLHSAMVATVWLCWGLCQLQPTLCWWLSCATISSYGASFHPNYCTRPCTCCWLPESVSSSTPWSKATAPLSPRLQRRTSSLQESSEVKGSDTALCVSNTCRGRWTLQYAYPHSAVLWSVHTMWMEAAHYLDSVDLLGKKCFEEALNSLFSILPLLRSE